jgi:hypothetical protein
MTGRHRTTRGDTVKYALPEVTKSIVGFIAPAAVVIGSSVTSVSDGGSHITQAEWVTAAVSAIVTAAGVFGFANKAPAGRTARPDVSEQDNVVTALSHLDEDDPNNYRG